jgi:lipopolysaccharide transport system ATP-binding protein
LQMSSNDIAISVERLSKRYDIYDRPGDRLKQFVLPRLRNLLSLGYKQYFREFWALKDVSFEIKRGETFAIIGRNGSGKSTLLQMICGTLTPTNGVIKVKGRVAALLELGSGFNPEFTGRENVYMNASVLGLSNHEINERYDDIVSFADIGEFIDQPVKNYSSGMLVRLAFAVIANVDADILIIDEALSVGDIVFTQKCMRFIKQFQKRGSLLFVSHDTNAVINLCKKAIFIDKGKIVYEGNAEKAVQKYSQFSMQELHSSELKSINDNKLETQDIQSESSKDDTTKITFFSQIENSSGYETGHAKILAIDLLNSSGEKFKFLRGGEDIDLQIMAETFKDLKSPILGWYLKDRLGQSLFGENTFKYVIPPIPVKAGKKIKANFKFKLPLLPNGSYSITAAIADGDPFNHIQHHWLHDALVLKVANNDLRYGLVGINFDQVTFGVN